MIRDCQAFFGKNRCAGSLGLTLLMICFMQKNPCLQFMLRFKHIYGGQRKAFLIKTNGGMYCHRQERNFANKEKDGSYIFLHQHAGPGSDRQRIRR
jgi:hypothetical protein